MLEESSDEELGISLRELTADEKYRSETKGSLIITSVSPHSAAAKVGLQPGDIVLKVGKSPVTTSTAFYQAIKERGLDKGVRLIVENKGMKRFVVLKK